MRMGRKKFKNLIVSILVPVMALSLFTGCVENVTKEDAESISVYLWSAALYNQYAPFIQSKLPDVNIEFVVGNNDLEFYEFMKEHGELPDIITTRRFSLHDATPLQDQLMDLSTTEEACSIYLSYLKNYTNSDGTINWLPLCGEADGIVANKDLFEKYDIPLPTDYDSFVSACQAFEAEGIRGCVTDLVYDYTCLELLQGLSIPELTSMEGLSWRQAYEDPTNKLDGLDTLVWPGVFERMEQFIKDTGIREEDLDISFNPLWEMFTEGKAAMIRSTGAFVTLYRKEGKVDPVFLPYFGQDGEQWILTYPSFQVALNKDLEKNEGKKEQALKVLQVMFSEEGQNVLAQGGDVVSYSRDVDLELSPALANLKSCVEGNHLYIRLASNEFFSVSKDVVQKMIRGEFDAKQAYEVFDEQLRDPPDNQEENVLSLDQGYSGHFDPKGGNEASSVMANTLRECYGSDVLIAPAFSFTGSVMKADYTEKMASSMIMPNSLLAWHREMTGEELKEYVKKWVEGDPDVLTPFNRGSLPTVSGISIEVLEEDGTYLLKSVLKDGKELGKEDHFQVTCLNTPDYAANGMDGFEMEEEGVRDAWKEYVKNGGTLKKPCNYITLR